MKPIASHTQRAWVVGHHFEHIGFAPFYAQQTALLLQRVNIWDTKKSIEDLFGGRTWIAFWMLLRVWITTNPPPQCWREPVENLWFVVFAEQDPGTVFRWGTILSPCGPTSKPAKCRTECKDLSLSIYILKTCVCIYIYMYGTPPPIHTLCAFYTVNYSVFVIFWTNFFEWYFETFFHMEHLLEGWYHVWGL